MRKRAGIAAAALCCLFFVSACASPASVNLPQLPTELRLQYRDASLIVSALCTETHINAAGEPCCDLLVKDVLAGDAAVGALLHCPNTAMTVEQSYLLYLSPGEDTFFAEDTPGYTVGGNPLQIVDSDVLYDGQRLSLSAIEQDIEALSAIISAPAPQLYYNTLAALVEASDEIFVGRVTQIEPKSSHSFSIRNGGATEKAQYSAQKVSVEAYASMKGSFSYGQRVQLIHCPARAGATLDALTLQPMGYTTDEAPALFDNAVYLFFLVRSPDPKQDYYFAVNPVEGYALVRGDLLEPSFFNAPLTDYATLTAAAQAIQTVTAQHPMVENPALTVVED